jgi:hypothetical protein
VVLFEGVVGFVGFFGFFSGAPQTVAAGFLEDGEIAESALVLAVDEGLFGVDGAEEAQLVREVAMGEGQAVGAEARETGFVVGLFVVLHDTGDVEAEDEEAACLR